MTLQQKFNEYIASGDTTISDEQRDWILPFIERCVGEERERIMKWTSENYSRSTQPIYAHVDLLELQSFLTQEDKIK